MIKFENVYKRFGEREVLSNFSLCLEKGDRLCIMGESGCGKTTLINLLLGFIKPDSGTVSLGGKAVAVFQEDRLCEDFSALTNVTLGMKKRDKAKAEKILRELSLDGDEKRPVRELSGGMKRRVAIARALAYNSDILLLDEAFTGLDGQTKHRVAEVINRLTEEKTVVIVSHDAEDAALLGAKVLCIEKQ